MFQTTNGKKEGSFKLHSKDKKSSGFMKVSQINTLQICYLVIAYVFKVVTPSSVYNGHAITDMDYTQSVL